MANRSDIDNAQTWSTFKAYILQLWDQSAAAQGFQIAAGNSATAAASSASSVAAGAARLFPDTATGLAATVEGGYFSTPSIDPNWATIIWRMVGGLAVDTLLRAAGGQASTQGIYPATDGATASTGVSPATLIPDASIGLSGTVTGLSCYTTDAGVAAKALLLTKNGDGTFTLNSSFDFTTVAGTNAIAWNPVVTAGQYLAIYITSGGLRYSNTTGKTLTYITGLPSTNTAVTGTSANTEIRFGWTIQTGVLARTFLVEQQAASNFQKIDGTSTTQGIYPATNGSFDLALGLTVFGNSAVASAGSLTALSVFTSGAATGALVVASINSDGTIKLQESKIVALAAGLNTFTNFNPHVEPGWLVGVYSPGALQYTTGGSLFYTTGLPGAATAKLSSAITSRIGWTMQSGVSPRVVSEEVRAKNTETALQALVTGTVASHAEYPAVSLGNVLAPAYTSFNLVPVSQDGVLSALSVYLSTVAGAGVLLVATMDASNAFTLVSSRPYNFGPGLNTITDWNPSVLAGQFIGVYTSTVSGVSYSTAGSTTGARYVAGIPGVATASSLLGATARFGLGFQVSNGAVRATVAERALEVIKFGGDGKGLLVAADATGAVDATAVFSSAMTQHPTPYVPPGTYAVTNLLRSGTGLWGPGRVRVNGVRYPLPLTPNDFSLRLKLRSSFAQLASSGSPLVLIGDSLQAHFAASTLSRHWFNQLAYLLNSESAPGSEPATVVVRDDDGTTGETAAFYGLTVSSGTVGTTGPVGKSVVLASGGYITFTGAYSQVDAFYNQLSGAGSLAFSYNGAAAYKTVSAAGTTSLDKSTGPSLTGQTASGTYQITATGGPVEITGLVRLAPTLATGGTAKPVYCMRAAYGGYTGSSFTTARIAAIIAQAQGMAGGTAPEYALALMTNDMLFGAAPRPATYEADLTRIVNQLVASGASRVTLITPTRPRFSNWGIYYTAGQDFDTFLACAQRVTKALGVSLLALDQIDLIGEGLSGSDGLHWGDLMQDRVLDHFARWRSNLNG